MEAAQACVQAIQTESSRQTSTRIVYVCIYVYVCVCVCVYLCESRKDISLITHDVCLRTYAQMTGVHFDGMNKYTLLIFALLTLSKVEVDFKMYKTIHAPRSLFFLLKKQLTLFRVCIRTGCLSPVCQSVYKAQLGGLTFRHEHLIYLIYLQV